MNVWEYIFPKDTSIVIWGAGRNGYKWSVFLQSINRNIKCFIDTYIQEKTIYGISCYNPTCMPNIKQEECILLISPGKHIEEIHEQALEFGFSRIYLGEILKFIPQYDNFNLENNFPPFGHFYSLYPSLVDVDNEYEEKTQIDFIGKDGIDFNIAQQLELLHNMNALYDSLPDWAMYGQDVLSNYRYRIDNPAFAFNDAAVLHFMLRLLKPKQLIEVGSGYSSAVTLDTREFYLSELEINFIEPYPELFYSLLKKGDRENVTMLGLRLQDIPLDMFKKLAPNDILFIDSTHVIKFGSDVEYLFFKILPILKKGVIVHLHDVFCPWEYPADWIRKGMGWNELYLLRAFLQYNNQWKILFYASFMEKQYRNEYNLDWQKKGAFFSGSFWMQKSE